MVEDDNILDPAYKRVDSPQNNTSAQLTAGATTWFEGDPVFADVVRDLQAQGVLDKSPFEIPLPYLSISQVELYLKCPLMFYRRYIKGEKRPPGIALVQGTTIHKAVEVGYKHVMDKGEIPPLDMALDVYSDSLNQNLTSDVVWDDDEGEEALSEAKSKDKVKDQGVKLLKIWHKDKLPTVKPRAVEKSFVTSFGGIPVVGKVDFIDRVDTPMDPNGPSSQILFHPALDVVVDNKVVGKSWSASQAKSKMQMSVYAHATGVSHQRYDLFIKSKTPKLAAVNTSRTAQEVRWAVKTFMDVANAISKGVFPATSPESYVCSPKFCGYYSSCRGGI